MLKWLLDGGISGKLIGCLCPLVVVFCMFLLRLLCCADVHGWLLQLYLDARFLRWWELALIWLLFQLLVWQFVSFCLFLVSCFILFFLLLFHFFAGYAIYSHCSVWSRAVEAFFGLGFTFTVIVAIFCFVIFILIEITPHSELINLYRSIWLVRIIV